MCVLGCQKSLHAHHDSQQQYTTTWRCRKIHCAFHFEQVLNSRLTFPCVHNDDAIDPRLPMTYSKVGSSHTVNVNMVKRHDRFHYGECMQHTPHWRHHQTHITHGLSTARFCHCKFPAFPANIASLTELSTTEYYSSCGTKVSQPASGCMVYYRLLKYSSDVRSTGAADTSMPAIPVFSCCLLLLSPWLNTVLAPLEFVNKHQ